jgi:hypothetical protein
MNNLFELVVTGLSIAVDWKSTARGVPELVSALCCYSVIALTFAVSDRKID